MVVVVVVASSLLVIAVGLANHCRIISSLIRWRQRFFSFWLELTRFKGVRRQRRQLANGLRKYAKIARIFARMKLYAFEERRFLILLVWLNLQMLICLLAKKAKMGRLAISFINEALRLQKIRLFYHRYVFFYCSCNVVYMLCMYDFVRMFIFL